MLTEAPPIPASVTQLLAGTNITLSPTNGKGVVTINASGGGSSPLTTKGDLWGFSTTNARVPVGTDGFIIQADSAQTLGVGYSTRAANLNNFALVNASQVLIGEASSSATPSIEVTDSTTYTTGPVYYGLRLTGSPTFTTTNLASGSGFITVDQTWVVNSVSTKTNFYGMTFSPTFSGTANPGFFGGILSQPVYSQSGKTVPSFYGLQLSPQVNAGTATTAIGALIDLQASGTITTGIGLTIGILHGIAGSTAWAMQVANYNSSFYGKTSFGFGSLTTPTAGVDVVGSTTTNSGFRLRSGTAPTSPNDGDMWYDGTNIKIRVGATTKTFTIT